MATSGTFNFAPTLGEIVIAAFGRCGIRRTELTMQHMADSRMESNLMMSDWTADGINLWEVQSTTIALNKGQAVYPIPSTVVFFLDCYVTIMSGDIPIDRLIFPISRSDYTALANKTQEGEPTTFWFDRLINPNLYLWLVPDQDNYYTLTYYYMRQAQDSELINGTQPEVPWYFLDAFAWGLTERLSYYYAPARSQQLEQRATKSWARALSVGTENVPVSIQPQLQGYFR
jgi:hypothetical protein